MRKKAYEVPYLERKAVTKAKQLPHLKRSDPAWRSGIGYEIATYQTPEQKRAAAEQKRQQLLNTSRWPWYGVSPRKLTKRAMKTPTYKSVRYAK